MSHLFYPRALQNRLKSIFEHFPVVVVSGARQVGKSTLLKMIWGDIPHVVFDPVLDIENAKREPDLFLANRKPPVILDEIQYAPEVVPAIKRRLEKNRAAGQYLLTGSQQWNVMKMLSESLAGRAAFLDLEGFSLSELAESPESNWLIKWLENDEKANFNRLPLKRSALEQTWRGFLPEVEFLPQDLIPTYFAGYQRTYIERDVRLLENISDLNEFSRFYRLCAALTAQEINYSQLGRDIGISSPTSKKWLKILESTFQWFEVPAFSGNTVKRISGKPKGYLSDPGLAAWSMAISSPEALASHPNWGGIFETAVIGDIRKLSTTLSVAPKFFHWRSHGGAEVDLILEWNGHFYPIEIKSTAHPARGDASGIRAFRKTFPKLSIKPGLVIAPTESFYPLTEEDFALPWDAC